MNKKLLNTGVQEFITQHLNTDIMSVLLKKSPFEGISVQELAQQIESKKKCRSKLPIWFKTPAIYYPKKLSIEQTSSEITARYKAECIQGNLLLDITGGFGVDSFFFSRRFKKVWHCEIDKELSEIAGYNFKILNAQNITTTVEDGIEFLRQSDQKFDWVYIDPSRRDDIRGKVFKLSDCFPNIPEQLDILFKKTANILLKTSPLLDLSAGIEDLQFVKDIHVVGVNNEVKELLWVLNKGFKEEPTINTINFNKDGKEVFHFRSEDEKKTVSNYAAPSKYLYEPNAVILKSGGFKSIGTRYSLKKLHVHTHLYTTDNLLKFPGRRFKIIQNIPYNKKELRSLKIEKANITTRNFSDSVADIRKKFNIKEGGDVYLFFVTDIYGAFRVLQCSKA